MYLDEAMHRRQRRRNRAQAALLLGGMAAVLGLCAWLLVGGAGLVTIAALGLFALALRPKVSPAWVLRMYGAQPLPPALAPGLHRLVGVLAERADLPRAPRLYYVPSSMMNAFAVGTREEAAVGVTDGLLRGLSGRELAGVLAHEISHVSAGDLAIMTLADTVGRLTHALAYAGLLLLVLGLPLLTTGAVTPLLVAATLTAVPTVVTLLQLALSRAREYDADLDAARLTGDPAGLASALQRLERHEGRIWERILVPHRRTPDPLLLRTHPPTEERVRRLQDLLPARVPRVEVPAGPYPPLGYRRVDGGARLRWPGIWR